MNNPTELAPGEGTTVGYCVEVNIGGDVWIDVSVSVPMRNRPEALALYQSLGAGGNLRIMQVQTTRRLVNLNPGQIGPQPK